MIGLRRPCESAVKLCHDTEGESWPCCVLTLINDKIKESTDIWNNKLCLCFSIWDFCCEISEGKLATRPLWRLWRRLTSDLKELNYTTIKKLRNMLSIKWVSYLRCLMLIDWDAVKCNKKLWYFQQRLKIRNTNQLILRTIFSASYSRCLKLKV